MSTEIDSRVSVSLHPMNVEKIDGYDEDTALVLGPVVTAFDAAYQGIGKVHTAREAAKTHPGWNEAMQIIQTQDMADAVFGSVAKQMDAQRASLAKSIAFLEKELSQPVEARADRPGISGEIREHCKKLPSAQRMGFIKQAIDAGDHVTAQACLGAPAYLSGVDAGIQNTLTRMYHEKANPQLAKRLKAMSGAKALLDERSGLLHSELEKAVGLPPHKVQQLRNAKTQAEQAFVLKDLA